jgi:hypothetical protein
MITDNQLIELVKLEKTRNNIKDIILNTVYNYYNDGKKTTLKSTVKDVEKIKQALAVALDLKVDDSIIVYIDNSFKNKDLKIKIRNFYDYPDFIDSLESSNYRYKTVEKSFTLGRTPFCEDKLVYSEPSEILKGYGDLYKSLPPFKTDNDMFNNQSNEIVGIRAKHIELKKQLNDYEQSLDWAIKSFINL